MVVNKLPQILGEKGLSIRELARRTGVTYSTVWAVVHGERRSVQLKVLESICLVLDIQPGDIYTVADIAVTPKVAPSNVTPSKVTKEKITARPEKNLADQTRKYAKPGSNWRSW